VIGEADDVFTNVVICDKLNWMAIDGLHGEELTVRAKIRYSHKGAPCIIREIGEDLVECRFPEKVRAATPGQAVVFYDEDDYVVGGGTIR
jgi:tRNA-specific 2-thiouridylase